MDRAVAECFADGGGVLLEFERGAGWDAVDVSWISKFASEREVLRPGRRAIKVKSISVEDMDGCSVQHVILGDLL